MIRTEACRGAHGWTCARGGSTGEGHSGISRAWNRCRSPAVRALQVPSRAQPSETEAKEDSMPETCQLSHVRPYPRRRCPVRGLLFGRCLCQCYVSIGGPGPAAPGNHTCCFFSSCRVLARFLVSWRMLYVSSRPCVPEECHCARGSTTSALPCVCVTGGYDMAASMGQGTCWGACCGSPSDSYGLCTCVHGLRRCVTWARTVVFFVAQGMSRRRPCRESPADRPTPVASTDEEKQLERCMATYEGDLWRKTYWPDGKLKTAMKVWYMCTAGGGGARVLHRHRRQGAERDTFLASRSADLLLLLRGQVPHRHGGPGGAPHRRR